MKVVLLAGGFGTRLSEETAVRPKPMVEIGGKPILWHIMKTYAAHGLTDFVVLGGYKVDFIRNYFLNYSQLSTDFTIDLSDGNIIWRRGKAEPWRVTVLDTGIDTMTGGRIRRAQEVIGDDTFCLTYGDGVSNIDIAELLKFHKQMGTDCTVSAVVPPGRFGVLSFDKSGQRVSHFREKDQMDVGMINGGYFVCEPSVFDLIDGDETIWERAPLERLASSGQLSAFKHFGFWQPMDTLRDKNVLESLWARNEAPWTSHW